MPTYGGFSPQPERYGGGPTPDETIAGVLDRALGDAHDTGDDSPQHAESVAMARMLADVWEAAQRMANQVIPLRMTTLLSRWEKILGAFPLSTDSDNARRARVNDRFARFTSDVTHSFVTSQLTAILGSVFVQVHNIAPADAVVYWPGDGSATADLPWYSTVCHLPIEVQKPTGYSEADFLAAVGKIGPLLDDSLPAYMTWCWYRNDAAHAGGGTWSDDADAGFYLDDALNLDFEVFA